MIDNSEKPLFASDEEAIENVKQKTTEDSRKTPPVSATARMLHLEIVTKMQKGIIVCLVAVVGVLFIVNAYIAQLPKRVPYVIEISDTGEAKYYENAVKLLDRWTPADSTQRYFLAHYITDLRSVSSDIYQNKTNVASVYSKTLAKAASVLENWYKNYNPIQRAEDVTVKIPIDEVSILKYSDTKWKLTWRETAIRKNDNIIVSDSQYEALLTVEYYTPNTERQLRENPIGLYVVDIDVSLLKNLM